MDTALWACLIFVAPNSRHFASKSALVVGAMTRLHYSEGLYRVFSKDNLRCIIVNFKAAVLTRSAYRDFHVFLSKRSFTLQSTRLFSFQPCISRAAR
jgi:hypothetical protein